MSKSMIKKISHQHAQSAIQKIELAFRNSSWPLPRPVASASGDIGSVERINNIVEGRTWWQVSFEEFLRCGAAELLHYLTPEGHAYYLPGIMTTTLQTLTEGRFTRLHEVATMLVLPTDPTYKDVWEEFGDGLFDGWGSEYFSTTARELIEKIERTRSIYNDEQCDCVSAFILVIGRFNTSEEDKLLNLLVDKFSDFWKNEKRNI